MVGSCDISPTWYQVQALVSSRCLLEVGGGGGGEPSQYMLKMAGKAVSSFDHSLISMDLRIIRNRSHHFKTEK